MTYHSDKGDESPFLSLNSVSLNTTVMRTIIFHDIVITVLDAQEVIAKANGNVPQYCNDCGIYWYMAEKHKFSERQAILEALENDCTTIVLENIS